MKPILAKIPWGGLALLTLLGLAAPAATPPPAAETNRVDLKDFSAFKLVTDRNIFDPNRRGPVVYTPRPERTVVDSFALTGTMSYSNVLLAFFDGSKSDYHKALKTSEQIAGHALTEIGHDKVKLASGTNLMELKVGMELRRSPDGRWTVAESSGTTYSSGSRRRDRDRRDADRSSSSRSSTPTNAPAPVPTDGQANTNLPPEMAGGAPPEMPPGAEMEASPNPPPDNAGGGDEDPIARMVRRRQQETGGGEANQNE